MNSDLHEMGLDTTDQWIVKRRGIKERRIAGPDVTTSDLAFEAAHKALDEEVSDGRIKKGELVCMPVFSGGLCLISRRMLE